VDKPENPEVVAQFSVINGVPEDLILVEGKLVVISSEYTGVTGYYNDASSSDTLVNIYDLSNISSPKQVKSFILAEDYYTSRSIGSKVYVIASGRLKKTDGDVEHYYYEDNEKKDLSLDKIKYLTSVSTNEQTLIAEVDVTNLDQLDLNSYLVDVSNAYVSEQNIYLADETYGSDASGGVPWQKLFGWKGVFGLLDETSGGVYQRAETEIYKFRIADDGLEYVGRARQPGVVVNQFSFDEYQGDLRLAMKSTDGSRVVVLDSDLNEIGASSYVAKGEQLYSSRFIGDRAYFVTYLVTDPLYVVDLSDHRQPQIVGELKIPGYSTYLHPYDETHLIGIGMDSEETVLRDDFGKVIGRSSRVTGMKMALFDVSNVNSPKQISQVKIGDSTTSSAILTNHKALLFSLKEQLIAIPVNNYNSVFEISDSQDYESLVSDYKDYRGSRVGEGYFVYSLNLTDGFKLKGVVSHDDSSYYSKTSSKSLRGLYIGDNLFTVSENMIKVSSLEDLELVGEVKIED
jgi:uncharacterized secreted protein with C-terminal beta-propeller domain